MEYFKWMLIGFLLFGLSNTGLAKTTLSPESDDYDEMEPQDEGDDYEGDDEANKSEMVQSNDVLTSATSIPPYFPVYNLIVNATEGQDALLHCDAKNLAKDNVLMWYNGSQFIATHLTTFNKNKFELVDQNTLRILNVEYKDRNQYVCSILPQRVNLTIHLNVIRPRAVMIYARGRDISDRSMTTTEGEKLVLECRAINLENAIIKWSLNGERASNHVSKIEDGKIIIDSLTNHHAGVYQCLGDDNSGDLPHAAATINVQYAPKISTHRHHINTIDGDTAELYCDYIAEPIATTHWLRHNSKIPYSVIPDKYTMRSTIHKGKNRTILFVNNVNKADLGDYQCQAENSLGLRHVNLHLMFEPETPQFENEHFDPVKKLTITNWLVRSKQPLVEAALDYKMKGTHSNWMTVSVQRTQSEAHTGIWKLTHELELPSGLWHVRMKVKNTEGWSKFSNEYDILVADDAEEPPEEIIYAGNIGGGTKGTSNSNQLSFVPSILVLCLLSSFRIVSAIAI